MNGAGGRIGVFGATSALAQAAVLRWAARGESLVLVARDARKLDTVAEAARARGAASVETQVAEFSEPARCESIAASASQTPGGLRVALLAWGSLSEPGRAAEDCAYLAAELGANFVAHACLAEALARRMAAGGGGTVAILGSIAGDRPSATNRAYAAAKAAIDMYARGLRIAMRPHGVRIVVVKPGPIATPMTAHLRPGFLWSTPEAAGRRIVDAIDSGSSTVYVPGYWRPILAIVRRLPDAW